LIQGQHRCLAVIRAGKGVVLDIRTGLSKTVFSKMDTGKPRTGSDALSIGGYTNPAILSGAIKAYTRITSGFVFKRYLTNQQILDFVKVNPFMPEAVRIGVSFYNNARLLTPSMFAACVYLFNQKDKDQYLQFLNAFTTGENISKSHLSPIYLLRERLITDLASKAKLPEKEKAALIVKAWNIFRNGDEIKVLKWRSDIEDFPTAI